MSRYNFCPAELLYFTYTCKHTHPLCFFLLHYSDHYLYYINNIPLNKGKDKLKTSGIIEYTPKRLAI